MYRLFFILALSLQLICAQRLLAQATPDTTQDQFVDVEQEPMPLVPIEKLIVYPEVAKRSGLQGHVTIEALVEKDGTVSKVRVIKCEYDVFKEPAIQAMKKATFSPAMQHGQPIRIWVTRTITFKLSTYDNTPLLGLPRRSSESTPLPLPKPAPKTYDINAPSLHPVHRPLIEMMIGQRTDSVRTVLQRFGIVSESVVNGDTILQSQTDSTDKYRVRKGRVTVSAHGANDVMITDIYAAQPFANMHRMMNDQSRDDLPTMTIYQYADSVKRTITTRTVQKQ